MKVNYRILRADRTVKFTGGTETGSWFTLERAKELVDYSAGEMIYEYDKDGNRMGEIL